MGRDNSLRFGPRAGSSSCQAYGGRISEHDLFREYIISFEFLELNLVDWKYL